MEKINNAMSAHWGMNTNIKAAFDLVLKTAVNNHIPKNDIDLTNVLWYLSGLYRKDFQIRLVYRDGFFVVHS